MSKKEIKSEVNDKAVQCQKELVELLAKYDCGLTWELLIREGGYNLNLSVAPKNKQE